MRRWARPKKRGTAGQQSLPGFGAVAERPRIETDRVALGSVETSRDAAAVAQKRAADVRKLVLSLIRGAGQRGCTCDEIAAAIGKTPNQISGRFTDLADLGLIMRSAERRPTRAGATAFVWVAVR
jgi:hypothetical protein